MKATTASTLSPLSLEISDLVKKHYQKRGWVGKAIKSGCAVPQHIDLLTLNLLFSAYLYYFCVISIIIINIILLKLNALTMLYLKNKGENELKLMINFPLKLFDFFSQSFPCIYFQGGKAHQGRECAAGAAAAHSSKVAISK